MLKRDVAVQRSDIDSIRRDVSETRVDIREIRGRQERDFRLLLGSLITVAVGVGALMAKGFGWLH